MKPVATAFDGGQNRFSKLIPITVSLRRWPHWVTTIIHSNKTSRICCLTRHGSSTEIGRKIQESLATDWHMSLGEAYKSKKSKSGFSNATNSFHTITLADRSNRRSWRHKPWRES